MKFGQRLAALLLLVALAIPGAAANQCDHSYVTQTVPATCTESGYSFQECSQCGDTQNYQTLPRLGHDLQDWFVETAATCTQPGVETAPCSRCDYRQQREIPATGHRNTQTQVAPTCEQDGYTQSICSVCGKTEKSNIIPATGHSFTEKVVEPTCEKDGYTQRTCSTCGKTEKTDILPAVGHSYFETLVEPGCEKEGYTERICSVCGDSEKTNVVPATGHDFQITLVEPTCTKDGYTQRQCRVCMKTEKSDPVGALGHEYDDGVIIRQPSETAAGQVKYTCVRCPDSYTKTLPRLYNPFVDVPEEEYFYRPVLWAVSEDITKGMDETHFAPLESCTRAQVVTFLWRYMGKPEPASLEHPFSDLVPSEYYYKAVLWAVEQGITNGMEAGKFAPNALCTRAQVVTFLYRTYGQPEVALRELFTDLDTQEYYYPAVVWAVDNEITNGMEPGIFSPHSVCTRAHTVTFLYRADQI